MVEVNLQPPPLPMRGADSIYSYENLPAYHHRKYIYASRFIKLVRAKTPKLTIYTQRSKCMFMENGPQPNYEMYFYTGVKVCMKYKFDLYFARIKHINNTMELRNEINNNKLEVIRII